MFNHVSSQDGSTSRPTVIGIGASAGGLKALQAFFEALPAETGLSFVVIVHLDPERESSMDELLQAKTQMPVTQVKAPTPLEANHVYVISPSKRLEATDSHLSISDFEEPRGRRLPIDHFFRSLAEAHGDGAGIILSGGGSDGSVGIKAIKERGGLVLAQDPKEAEHDGMPRSAIATGLVDRVLPVREMATELVEMLQHVPQLPDEPDALGDGEAKLLRQVLGYLQAQMGHDFSGYKRSTVLRRLHRRMQISRVQGLGAYFEHLQANPSEVEALFKDLLVGVTTFFRDSDSFEALRERIIPKLFDGKDGNDSVRVWVVGCSTGEEAYSIAMLLQEHAANLHFSPNIKVFASDLSEEGLTTARAGRYPHSIEADVSEERLRQFFTREDDHYRVRRSLRERVVFAKHSALRDPPFSRIDLISCRNLLIYLQRKQQEQVFQIFHYALRPEGYLFLGRSETTDRTDLFRAFDKEHHLYQARERAGEVSYPPTMQEGMPDLPKLQPRTGGEEASFEGSGTTLHREALEASAPPSVLVDERYGVVHLSERAGRYLEPSGGTLSSDITELVRPELRAELSEALMLVFGEGSPTVARPIQVQFNGRPRTVYLTVRPTRREEDAEPLALVLFNEGETSEDALSEHEVEGSGGPADERLRRELRETRKRLREIKEQYETSREELQAQNEELRSINEEYKSTTEELETSKEELQSLNEELQTVNSELESKLEELARAHSDLKNLIAATEVGTVFLDQGLQIRRFTPPMKEFFNIRESDQGRPIGDLTHKLKYDALEADAERVLEELIPVEREVEGAGGKWYLVRVRPYRTVEDTIEGVALTFVDITELKRTEQELRQAKELAEMIVDTVREGLLVLDDDLRVQVASASFYEKFGVEPEETEGHYVYELGDGQWGIPELREVLEEVLPDNDVFNDFKVTQAFESIGERSMFLNARRLDGQQKILLAIEDVTERERAMEELKALNETLEERVEERTAQVRELSSRLTMAEQKERRRIAQILHDDLQQRLYGIGMRMTFLRRHVRSGDSQEQILEQVRQAETWIDEAVETTRQLSVDLSPPVLKGEGLTDTLGWLKTQMKKMHDLEVEIEAEHAFYIPSEDMRVFLFQVVRELLFNVVKHAGVDCATVELTEAGDYLALRVVDGGQGFDASAIESQEDQAGFGLTAARERLKLIGGRLEIESAPGEGTRATAFAPLSEVQLEPSSEHDSPDE